ncbi:MAG: Ku protein [Burkholderiales bacterium]
MAARPAANGSISFGLVSIPVKLYTATRSKSVAFKLIHAKDNSRIQQKVFCPVENAAIERSELVRGFEVDKGVLVTFTDEEIKALEAHDDHTIDIREFVPLSRVDAIYFENAYHLGCSAESARAYRLLAHALEATGCVALAIFTMRSKEYLVLIRPYEKGLMLHTMYYADEVVLVKEIERGAESPVTAQELSMAKRLISDLTHDKFEPEKYKDGYRERVLAAAQQKVEGRQTISQAPETHKAKVIDLYGALKASLERRGIQFGDAAGKDEAESASDSSADSKRAMRGAHANAGGSRRRR